MELVALSHGQTADQFVIAEEVVDGIDDRTVHGFAAGFQQVAELSQMTPARTHSKERFLYCDTW